MLILLPLPRMEWEAPLTVDSEDFVPFRRSGHLNGSQFFPTLSKTPVLETGAQCLLWGYLGHCQDVAQVSESINS